MVAAPVVHLWFSNDDALEAAERYCALFPNSRIAGVTRYTEAGRETHGHEPGSVMTVSFELDGLRCVVLNGGPAFSLSPAFSFVIECDSQEEIDRYWEALAEGGDPAAQVCGWLQDRFGVSWQIVPRTIGGLTMDEWFSVGEPAARERLMGAMMAMSKLDIAALEAAARGA